MGKQAAQAKKVYYREFRETVYKMTSWLISWSRESLISYMGMLARRLERNGMSNIRNYISS